MNDLAQQATGARRLQPYEDYSPTGLKWLPEVPSHWRMTRLKNAAAVRPSNVDKHTVEGEQPVRLCNYTDVYKNEQLVEAQDFMRASASASEIAKFTLALGDVLITKDSETPNDIAVPALVAQDLHGVLCGYHLTQIRPHATLMVGAYLARAFVSNGVRDQFRISAKGVTRFGLSHASIANSLFPCPPIDEQRTIATFLDRETGKIDALIAKKQRLIELLQEKRTALITHAVTKGLDPNAPTKPSGIVWLGDIPAHWDLVPLGMMLRRITYGFTNPMPAADEGPYMITANDIGDGEVLYTSARRTTQQAFECLLTDKSRPREGDILITKDGTLGRVAVADGAPLCINQSVALLRVDGARTSVNFIQNALRASAYQDRMVFEAGGTTIKHLYITRLAKMPVALPPLKEQQAICESATRQRVVVDRLMERVRKAVNRLREYRAALISAAVTGKIDVREEAA